MSDSEKAAWWTVGIVAVTIAAYCAFILFCGHGPATSAVFSLLALTALPGFRRRSRAWRTFDEREQMIAQKALLAAFRALWVVFISAVLLIGFDKGWQTSVTLPLWSLAEALYWAITLVLGTQAVTTIVLARGVVRV